MNIKRKLFGVLSILLFLLSIIPLNVVAEHVPPDESPVEEGVDGSIDDCLIPYSFLNELPGYFDGNTEVIVEDNEDFLNDENFNPNSNDFTIEAYIQADNIDQISYIVSKRVNGGLFEQW